MSIRIESLAHGGDAVGRDAEGRVVFVRGGCPGDLVSVRLTSERDRFAFGQVDEVLEPSSSRVDPPCPYFGSCGGCQWQHVGYAAQLEAKRAIVADAISRIGRCDPGLVRETLPSPAEYGYRNKIELTVASTAGRTRVGFSALHSDELVEVERCLLLPGDRSGTPASLAGALRFLSRGDQLGVERVALRTAAHGGDSEVALWGRPGPMRRSTTARVLGEATSATGVTRVLFKGPVKERKVAKVEVLSGRGWWREALGGHQYAVSSPTFFQVNTGAAETLVAEVLETLAPDGTDRVLDVFAGAGTFTLPIARRAGETIAVEASAFALGDLKRNLDSAGLQARVEPGDAARVLAGVGAVDAAVVDPPRAGLSDGVVAALTTAAPERLVYVSCDPATLARDAARLLEAGYALRSVTPVDLFPQTFHVEAVALFERA